MGSACVGTFSSSSSSSSSSSLASSSASHFRSHIAYFRASIKFGSQAFRPAWKASNALSNSSNSKQATPFLYNEGS